MTVQELNFTDIALREREWLDAHGTQWRWIGTVWCEWSDAGNGGWHPHGLTVYLTGPFTAVDLADEIGEYPDPGWWRIEI